jgi:hypothetical protein
VHLAIFKGGFLAPLSKKSEDGGTGGKETYAEFISYGGNIWRLKSVTYLLTKGKLHNTCSRFIQNLQSFLSV